MFEYGTGFTIGFINFCPMKVEDAETGLSVSIISLLFILLRFSQVMLSRSIFVSFRFTICLFSFVEDLMWQLNNLAVEILL